MTDMTSTEDRILPPKPVIKNLMWCPPNQTLPIKLATTEDRLMLYANADSHDWQEYVPDRVNAPSPTGGGTLVNYWEGWSPAEYTLTLRSYWVLVPNSYTQIEPGDVFEKEYGWTTGIEVTNAQTISAELGVAVEGLSAKISASFSQSVTTSSQQQESSLYKVGSPKDGFTRVWMLWQLVDELVALDASGNVISNPTRQGDVNWSQHNESGAYLSYTNLKQRFPASMTLPVRKDFPN